MKLLPFLLSLMGGAAAWVILVIVDPQQFDSENVFSLALLMLASGAIGWSIAFARSRPAHYLLTYLAVVLACAGVADSLLLLLIGLIPVLAVVWYFQRYRPDILDDRAD
jgi:hypothetical protein